MSWSWVRPLGATTLIGFLLGALVGGVGGRLAMRLIFLTTGSQVDGVTSDDGFIIGRLSMATLGLIAFGGVAGVIGAFTYLGVRPFLIGPRWLQLLTCATAPGILLAGLIIKPDGVDFTLLSPVWLSIALFVAIPALFGLLAALAVDWSLRPGGWTETRHPALVSAPALFLLFPPMPILIGVPVAAVHAVRWSARRWTRVRGWLDAPTAIWTGRAGWSAVALFGVALLIEDLRALY